MASTQSMLYSVPPEILNGIISLLDPISLINLSQVSKSLRQYIDPIEFDFQQRLLALELLPEYGNPDPNPVDTALFIKRRPISELMHSTQDWWENSQYACCGCMKMLPHVRFEDGDLFNTTTRKPLESYVEYQSMMFTEWKPTATKEERMASTQKQMLTMFIKEHEERYEAAYYPYNPTRSITRPRRKDDEDPYVETFIPLIVGRLRHERRCLECKSQKKLLGPTRFLNGHPEAPIVMCEDPEGLRKVTFNWLFPSLLPRLPDAEKLPMDRVIDWVITFEDENVLDSEQRIYSLQQRMYSLQQRRVHQIRCAGCRKWQGSRAFGITIMGWPMDVLWPRRARSALKLASGSSLCHHCDAKTNGKAATATRLLKAALPALKQQLYVELRSLWAAWENIVRMIRNLLVNNGKTETWKEIATHSADPRWRQIRIGVGNNLDWWQMEKNLSETEWWYPRLLTPKHFAKPIRVKDLTTLLARKRLVEKSLSWFLEDLEAYKLPVDAVSASDERRNLWTDTDIRDRPRHYNLLLDDLVRFLEQYEVRHQSILDIQAAYNKLRRARSSKDYEFLLSALMPPDEYGRKL